MSGSTEDYTVYLYDGDLYGFKEMVKSEDFLYRYGCYLGEKKKLKVDFSIFDVSRVRNMDDMFKNAVLFNQPIGDWNVSNVRTMEKMFYNAKSFNQPIGNWDVSKVTNMKEMFESAESFNQPIGNWDVSKVTNMENMFYEAYNFNQPIGNWDVSKVTNMENMFYEAYNFNQPIGSWDVSKVTNMYGMFYEAKSFNQPIGNWNVSEVTNMWGMFKKAESFNQPIGNWNVSKVTRMYSMFKDAKSFNQDISKWDVSKVKEIESIDFPKPLKPKIAYSVYQWFLKDKITRNAAEKIFGSAAKLKEYEQEQNREAIHGSLPSSRASPSVKTSLPRSIVYDVIELGQKPISAYKYSPKENNFPILFADKNDYKVIMSLDLEKVLKDTNNIMYECKPDTPLDNLAIRRDQVKSTAYLQTSVLGIQIASVGVVELSSIQKTMKSLKERMEHNRKQTQKKLSALKPNKSARKKALLDTKIMPYIYKLKAVSEKKLGRLASETVLQQIGNFAVSANHCQKMEPVQVYKLIKVKGKSASKKRSASKSKSAKRAKSV
jgi:surface protein